MAHIILVGPGEMRDHSVQDITVMIITFSKKMATIGQGRILCVVLCMLIRHGKKVMHSMSAQFISLEMNDKALDETHASKDPN